MFRKKSHKKRAEQQIYDEWFEKGSSYHDAVSKENRSIYERLLDKKDAYEDAAPTEDDIAKKVRAFSETYKGIKFRRKFW